MLRGAEKLVPADYWCPYGAQDLVKGGVLQLDAGRDAAPALKKSQSGATFFLPPPPPK